MNTLTNPFDILPANMFNVLSTQGGLQRHYLAILLRIYEMAEFNRFGLTREQVVAEIVDYLNQLGSDIFQNMSYEADLSDDPQPDNVQEYASGSSAAWLRPAGSNESRKLTTPS